MVLQHSALKEEKVTFYLFSKQRPQVTISALYFSKKLLRSFIYKNFNDNWQKKLAALFYKNIEGYLYCG
jgi:hypothetical protein